MPEALTPDEVAAASACWCLPDVLPSVLYELDAIRVALGGDVMTPNEVAAASACWCVPDFNRAALYLLEQISANSGGGGSAQMSCGNGAPVAAPTDPTECAIYYDNAAGGVPYFWNVGTAAWN